MRELECEFLGEAGDLCYMAGDYAVAEDYVTLQATWVEEWNRVNNYRQ